MRWMHILACSLVAFSHGSNDGQKTMGIITLILATHFCRFGYTVNNVPFWVMLACAIAIGLGTTIGGWRIIKTVGTKISKQPITHVQGFGASMATALVILIASRVGAPISTTHTLNSAVAGGTIPCYGPSKLNRKTIQNILTAWVLTVPAAAALAALCYTIIQNSVEEIKQIIAGRMYSGKVIFCPRVKTLASERLLARQIASRRRGLICL